MAKTSAKAKMAKALEMAEKEKAKEKAREEKEKAKAEKERAKVEKDAEKERVKAEKERERAEKEKVRAAREAELEDLREQRRLLRLETERKKLEAEKEKSEKADKQLRTHRQQLQQHQMSGDKDRERREKTHIKSQHILSSFLGVPPPKPKPTTDTPHTTDPTDPSSPSSHSPISSSPVPSPLPFPPADAPQPLFHPFQPKPNTVMAPLHRIPPASPDELSFMDHSLSLPSASSSPPSPSTIRPLYPARPGGRRRRGFRWAGRAMHSRRSKLIQHHTSYRPPWWGYFPLSSAVILPHAPFARDPALNYDVDSDEEWGNEPEGEELESGDEGGDEEEEKVGRIRADGYEEDGDFVVPEDEDEGVALGAMAEGRVVDKGGVRRVVIRPVIRGPRVEGAEVTADVRELLKYTGWRVEPPPVDVGRKKEGDTNGADGRRERGTKKRSSAAVSDQDEQQLPAKKLKTDSSTDSTEERAASGLDTQATQSTDAAAVSTPQVKKKAKRVIIPQSASSLQPSAASQLATPARPLVSPPSPPPQSSNAPAAPPATPPSQASKDVGEQHKHALEPQADVVASAEDSHSGIESMNGEPVTDELSTVEVDMSELGTDGIGAGTAEAIAV